MRLLQHAVSREELTKMAQESFGNLVKAVVDVELDIMVIDAGLHADEEALLLQQGSQQHNLWGINLYPELTGDDFIEFDSMINLRPSQGNMTRGVDDPHIQQHIRDIVSKWVR